MNSTLPARTTRTARTARTAVPLLLAAAALALAGCAGTAGSSPSSDLAADGGGPIAAPGEVRGQGTVLQVDDEAAQLCLGAVAESYPPQCSGPEVIGWDWDAVDIKETASGTTWGTFAVTGTWDGTALTITEPAIPLALYDPMPTDPDPRLDPANAGESSEDTLTQIQDDITAATTDGTQPWPILMSWPENGYLWVTVTYDDGTIQDYYDGLYGADVVIVTSALVDVEA